LVFSHWLLNIWTRKLCSNLVFYRLLVCAAMFSSTRSGAWRRMVIELSPTIIFFFPFFLSPDNQVYNYLFCFLIVNISPHSFYFLFCFYYFYRSFFFCNLVLELHLLICFIFSFSLYVFYSFGPHSFNFLFHSYSF